MRYLVTGGASFVGAGLVRRLAADGHEVRVLGHSTVRRLDGVPCVIRWGDIRDQGAVRFAARGCDGIIHAAYAPFGTDARTILDIAVRGMRSVLDACESEGVRDLMLVSSPLASHDVPVPAPETVPLSVPDPLDTRYAYGGGKLISEQMAAAWHEAGALDRVIIARAFNVFGPDMGRTHVIPEFALRMAALDRECPKGIIPFPIRGTGLEARAFCYVDDCAEQLALLLAKAGPGASAWNVGSMEERTVITVAHAVGGHFGRRISCVRGKLWDGTPPRRVPDTAKIQMLGYEPSVSFADGLARTVAWYQEHEHA